MLFIQSLCVECNLCLSHVRGSKVTRVQSAIVHNQIWKTEKKTDGDAVAHLFFMFLAERKKMEKG